MKINLLLLFLLFFILGCSLSSGPYGPHIPRENIPNETATNVKENIKLLYSGNPKVRLEAIYKLLEGGKKSIAAMPFLLGMLGDRGHVVKYFIWPVKYDEAFVGEAAARTLGRIGDTTAVEPLISYMNNKDYLVRCNAMVALTSLKTFAEIQDSRIFDSIALATKDENLKVRLLAIESLYFFRGNPIIPHLLEEALKEQTPAIQLAVAYYLRDIDILRAIEIYVRLLKNKDSQIHSEASVGLSHIRYTKAIKPLIEALQDKDESVRCNAALGLGVLEDERAIEPLIKMLNDKSENVIIEVMAALRKITGEDFGQDIPKWNKWLVEKRSIEKLESEQYQFGDR